MIKSGELVGVTKGRVVAKDKDGNAFSVSVDDERIKTGELVHVSTGLITVKDKNGNTFKVSKDDPRYLSGEYVGVSRGNKWIKNIALNERKCVPKTEIEVYLNNGWVLGKKL